VVKSIQETYAPNLACFGCGPANPKGLHVRSFPDGDEVVAEWQPSKEYEAFAGNVERRDHRNAARLSLQLVRSVALDAEERAPTSRRAPSRLSIRSNCCVQRRVIDRVKLVARVVRVN
jgi:hypothetical protein